MQLGIWLHSSKDPDLRVTASVVRRSTQLGVPCLVPQEQHSSHMPGVRPVSDERFFQEIDFLVVLGGDGSMLSAARNSARYAVPMLGVNLGHRGFMTECEPDQVDEALEALVDGKYAVDERMMLQGTLFNAAGRVLWQGDALNDIVLSNRTAVQLIKVETSIGDCLLEKTACDAMIVSSPTGSTAYSMAAGGPIVHPQMQCMVLAPVCPSTLTVRPMILSGEDQLTLRIYEPEQQGMVVADGQNRADMSSEDRLIIQHSPYSAKLIRIYPRSFYQVLRDKRADWAKDQYM